MRIKLLAIAREVLPNLFRSLGDRGIVVTGIPDDAEFVACTFDLYHDCFVFQVRSSEFEDVPTGRLVPYLAVEVCTPPESPPPPAENRVATSNDEAEVSAVLTRGGTTYGEAAAWAELRRESEEVAVAELEGEFEKRSQTPRGGFF